MRVLYMLVLAIFASPLVSFAQSIGDFRTFQSGNWNAVNTWARFDGSTWVNPAPNTPTSADGAITIRSPHVVTVTTPVTIDQTTVQTGGTITVNSGQALTIALGTGVDLTNSGTINTTSESQLVFQTGASYAHAENGGTIPLATWSTNSTCNIIGVVGTAPVNLSPSGGFYNFTWNSTSQNTTVDLGGNLVNVRGDFTVLGTNSQPLELSGVAASSPINITGNLNVQGASRVLFTVSGSITVNVGGDFNYTATNTTGLIMTSTGSSIFNLAGNFNMSTPAVAIDFSVGSGSTVLNLLGDFSITSGQIRSTSTGGGTINFNKSGTQNFTNTGVIQNLVSYTISAATTLNVTAESPMSGTGTLTVNGVLIVGSVYSGGAIVANTAVGNIRVGGTRTYNPGSRITYGAISAGQSIGSGHPTSPGVTTEINNASGVAFGVGDTGNSGASTLLIPGNLVLTSGNLNIVSSGGAVRSLTLNGSVTANGNYITVSGPNTDIVINGSGAFGTFPFPPGTQSIRNLTLNLTGSGSVTFASDLTITGTATLATSTTLFFPGHALTLAGNYSASTGAVLSSNSGSTLNLTGTAALTSALAFSPSGNTLNTFTLNMTNSGTSATIGSSLTVTSALNLIAGQLSNAGGNLSLNSGATLTRNSAGSVTTISPTGGPWNLIYTGGSLTTGLEIPASGNLTSLTASTNNPSTITLSLAINVANAFNISAAGITFTSGNNNVAAGSFTNAGIFNAPGSGAISGLTLSGNFVNNGTYNDNGGTVVVKSSLSMTGSMITTTTFNNITINSGATLTPPATLSLLGNFINNGGFAAGTGSVAFNGTVGAKTVSGTTNTQFNNLTLNKSNSGVSLSALSTQTITNSLTLTAGQLIGTNFIMAGGSTISRNSAASITTTSPTGGPWNLIYTGGSLTTSLEIPSSGGILSLAINSSSGAVITLSQNLSVTNGFSNSLSNRTFTSGNNNVTLGTFSNGGIFNASGASASTGLTLSGNFSNSGTFNNNTGLLVIAGNVTMSGSSITTTNFNDITINSAAALVPAATLNIQGSFINNGTFTSGTGVVVFNGTAGPKTISGSTNTQFYNLTLNKNVAGTALSVSVPETVTNTLALVVGQLNITSGSLSMSNGATITRASTASTIMTSSPGGGPWNVVYNLVSLTTGLEIPASGDILTLLVSSGVGTTITLSGNLIIANSFTIVAQSTGPTFTSGTHSITASTMVNGGIFNAPTSGASLTLTSNLTNNGTFNGGTGTVVFNGTSNILGSSSTTFNHVIISSIGTLNGPVNLQLTGNFTNNGAFVAGSGTVTFSGTTTQKILGTTVNTFNNIQANNTGSSGVSVESNQNLGGILTLGANAKFDADGTSNTAVFTMLSLNDHPVQDAQIATIPSTSSVVGSVTVQRYMGPANADDRFLSFPVTTATVAQLQDDFSVTGSFTGTSYPCTGCANNGPSLNYYDETIPGTFQSGYLPTPVKGGSNTEILVPGRGYDAYMWSGTSPITVDVFAPVNQGTLNFTVTRTNSVPAQPTADGWNLLGNPYPSAIIWDAGPGWTSNLIDPTVYVWDRQISADRMYNNSTGVGNLPNGIISSGQAFFVYANTGGTPALSINEQAKIANQATTAYYRTARVNYSAIRMSLSNQKSMDESYVVVYDNATPDYDQGLDALKLETGKEALLVAPVDEEKRKLGFYALNAGYNKDIPLYLKAAKEGTCQLSFTNENQFKDFENLFLIDKYLGQSSLLSTPYSFEVTKNTLTMENRFVISHNPINPGDTETILSVYPNPVPLSSQLSIEINSAQVQNVLFLDNMGRVMGQIPTTTDQGITRGTLNVGNFSSGLYFVRVWTKDKVLVEKVVIR